MPRRFPYWFVGTLAAWLVYTIVWTWISLERLYLLRASVFDLGIYAQLGWRNYSAPLSPANWLGTALNFGGSIFLSPTTLGGYPTILAAQSCALGSGVVLVYLVARQYALRPPVAFGLAAAYLLYFPLSGINFSDAHYQAYLIPLFLLGVWLYLRGNFILSFVLLTLAGLIQFPLGIFPLFFGIQLLVPEVFGSIARRMEPTDPGRGQPRSLVSLLRVFARGRFTRSRSPTPTWYTYALPLTAGALLIGAWLTSDLYTTNYTVVRLVHASSVGVLPNLPVKLWSLFLILAPLAFLPLLSPRWFPFCVPFFFAMFYINYWGYTYPYIATSWYPFLVVPFLFLATVDGVAKIREGSTWIHGVRRWVHRPASDSHRSGETSPDASGRSTSPEKRGVRWPGFYDRPARSSALSVVVVVTLTIVSASFLTPYGPWNGSTDANFRLPVFDQYNHTLYDEFQKLASFIPLSDPSVLLQDNMPELLPRPTFPGLLPPLVPGPFHTVAYNLTWQSPNGSWNPIDPDYVIADPNPNPFGYFTAQGEFPFNISMEQIVRELYASYDYGIVGEASGMLLLEHYYSGPLRYYVPSAAAFPSSAFRSNVSTPSPACGGRCLVVTHQTNHQTAWSGPYAFLSPGTYAFSVHLGLANWTPGDRVIIDVTADSGATLLNSIPLSGLTVGPALSPLFLNTTMFVGAVTPDVEVRAVDSGFNGSLAMYGVTVHEVAPPSSVYRVGNTSHDAAIYRLLALVPSGSKVLADPALGAYFHNRTLVAPSSSSPTPNNTPYELYDPATPSPCAPDAADSLCSIVNESYTSRTYSIIAQVDGVTLLARSPAPLTTYSPLQENISTSALSTTGGVGQEFTTRSGGNLTVTNQTNDGFAWYGPYVSLSPGTYSLRFDLSVSNTSALNRMILGTSTAEGRTWLATLELNGTAFPRPNALVPVSLELVLPAFADGVEFAGFGVDWTGVITLSQVSLVETSPPG